MWSLDNIRYVNNKVLPNVKVDNCQRNERIHNEPNLNLFLCINEFFRFRFYIGKQYQIDWVKDIKYQKVYFEIFI